MTQVRVNQLCPGDIFEMSVHRWKVRKIENGRLYYTMVRESYLGGNHGVYSVGSGSNQFVNLIARQDEKFLG
jgi:hypothetical protein